MRHGFASLLLVFLAGCESCGGCGPEPEESTRPPADPGSEAAAVPEPEPEPDPCLATDADLAEWDEEAAVGSAELPAGAGGEALGEAPVLYLGDAVHFGGASLGTAEEAAALLVETELPADEPLVLALRASDPVSRVAPIIRALADRTFALVVVETDRETECRLLRQVTFGLKTEDDHGWVTFPTTRPASDLLTALSGADLPRRVQLID